MTRRSGYDYYTDTSVEVWRRGGNSDRLDYDRVQSHYYDGRSPEQAAACEMRRWQQQREAREMQDEAERQEAEYYAQMQQEYEAQDRAYYESIERELRLDAEYGPIIHPPSDPVPF